MSTDPTPVDSEPGRLLMVMGVSGSGKSTIGRALADRLGVPFQDGDELHPAANVTKMGRGEPLDDTDRLPWLGAVGAWLAAHPGGGVIACSALKRSYRDRLRSHAPDLEVVHLQGSPELIAERQRHRQRHGPGHFMPATLLDSQFAALEPLTPDEPGLIVDVADDIATIVDRVIGRR